MITGAKIREFRRDQNWTIGHLSELLGIKVWKLQSIERSAEAVPPQIAKSIETLARAVNANTVPANTNKPRHSFRDFRRSKRFSVMPPFTSAPSCPCGNALCALSPTGDDDWDGNHLWKFLGRYCGKTCYVDSNATVVPRPLRHPPRDLPLDDFQRWTNFSKTPSFSVLPDCPCGTPRCRLRPKTDFDSGGRHFWKFKGWKCQRVSYIDSSGAIVPPPPGLTRNPLLREPLLQKRCSHCGRMRLLNRQFRSRLGCRIAILSCFRSTGDPANQVHDPPEYFREIDGRVRPLTTEDLEKLRGRSNYKFPLPVCNSTGCQRKGKRMERSSELLLKDAVGKSFRVATYCCRPAKPSSRHYAYRGLPFGEVVQKISKGCYRWLDAETGEPRETVQNRRPIRRDRVMPPVRCQEHDCELKQMRGPWTIRGFKQWLANCVVGREEYKVRSDGSTQLRGSKWQINKGGRPAAGMSEQRKADGIRLLKLMLEFVHERRNVKGALRRAMTSVYPNHDPISAYEVARKTIKEYTKTFPDDPFVREWVTFLKPTGNRN